MVLASHCASFQAECRGFETRLPLQSLLDLHGIPRRRCVLPDYTPRVRSRIFAALLITFGAALIGYVMARLPAPDVPSAFWIGNFSAPWAVLAFLAGWSQRRVLPAMLVAVLAEVACVVGFYDLPGMLTGFCRGMPLDYCLGAPQGTSPIWLELTLFQMWLRGSAGQWLIAGVGAGVVYGYLGAWWGRTRSLVPAALLVLPFFVEPLAWQAYEGHLRGPAIVWVCEALAGAGLLAVMILASRRPTLSGAE